MGMFDDLRCEVPLPDGYEGSFQTKDFYCALETYVIRADGHLEVLRYDLVKEPGWEHLRRTNERWEQVPYHGMIRFYGYEKDDEGIAGSYDQSRWHEYEAKFTDGLLVEIKAVAPIG